MYFGPEMFVPLTDPKRQREIFKSTVNRIEVETHSYCNRRCDYCPNVTGDRLGPNIRIKPAVWRKLLSDLAEVDFSHAMVLNSYNEPLYDKEIIERIAEARSVLPKAQLMIYTNGDYLTPEYTDELAKAGLNYLHVSIHLKRGETFTDLYVLNRIAEVSHRIARQARFRLMRPNDSIIADFEHPDMKIESRAINFSKHGNDRGGLLPGLSPKNLRTDPCTFVFSHFHMGFGGNVVPCCHIRSDRPEHAQHVVGNLETANSIFDIFFGGKAAAWRRALVDDQFKSGPCATCTAPVMITHPPNWREVLRSIHQRNVVPIEQAIAAERARRAAASKQGEAG